MGAVCVSADRSAVLRMDSVARLRALEGAWRALERDAQPPTCDFAWALACALHSRSALRILAAPTPDGLGAIAPLVVAGPRRDRLELLGMRDLGEPTDLVYADACHVAALAAALARSGSGLFLGRVPQESPVERALRDAYRGRGVVVARRAAAAPFIELDAGWRRPGGNLNGGRRSDLRRARRRAAAIGSVGFEMHLPDGDSAPALLRDAFAIEASGWKGETGTALASDARLGALYRAYALAEARAGRLRLAFLTVGGRRVAMQLGVEKGARFWLLKMGYDQSFRSCSPGTLLLLDAVRWAADRGLESFELMGVPEPWTAVWTDRARPQVAIAAYPARLKALPHLASDGLLYVGKAFDREGRDSGASGEATRSR
jgi:CelD/BcsL family acetyltransferase involved in cellulose biosynthesis